MTTEDTGFYPGKLLSIKKEENSEVKNNVVNLKADQDGIDKCVNRIMNKYHAKRLTTIYAVTIDVEGNVDINLGDKGASVKTYMLAVSCLDMLKQNLVANCTKDVLGSVNG